MVNVTAIFFDRLFDFILFFAILLLFFVCFLLLFFCTRALVRLLPSHYHWKSADGGLRQTW